MAFQVQGKLYRVFDTEKKTDTFQAREFVLEVVDGQYPQMIKFQLTQDKCALIDDYSEGQELTVHFDLRGREWNDRFFTNLSAWKIETGAGSQGGAQQGGAPGNQAGGDDSLMQAQEKAAAQQASQLADFDDDIPF